MAYVPVVPPSQPSPRARELAQRLEPVLREYLRDHPELAPSDLRQALDLAARRLPIRGGSAPAPSRMLLGAGLALLAGAGLGAYLWMEQGGGGGAGAMPMPWIVAGVLALVAVLMVVRRRG